MAYVQPVQHATKLERAMMELITDHPFHAAILLQHTITADYTIPTACVNAHGDVRYNPDWFETLTIDEIVFVLCHENMHYMYMHMTRRMGRPPKKWNIACDGVINETLIATAVRSMPEGGVRWPGAADKNAELVFKEMFEDNQPDEPPVTPPPQPEDSDDPDDGEDDGDQSEPSAGDEDSNEDTSEDSGSGSDEDSTEDGDGDGTGSSDDDADEDGDSSGAGGDTDEGKADHPGDAGVPDWGIGEDIDDSEPMSESEKNILADKMTGEVLQARNAAKQVGKMPDLLEKFVSKLVEVNVPWYEIVSRWFTANGVTDYTYENLDRRFISRHTYLPYYAGKGMSISVIIIDVSYSINKAEMDNFEAHYNDILMAGQPELLVVLYVSTNVVGVEEYTPADYPIQLSRTARGGTDMTAGLDYVLEHYPTAESIIVLTDGETPFGEEIDIPTMWAITSPDITAPWGETVYLEVK